MLRRRDTTEYVTDLVNYDRVRSLLRMIACRRRYLAQREAQAAARRAETQGGKESYSILLIWGTY